jgi:hypothetical protein
MTFVDSFRNEEIPEKLKKFLTNLFVVMLNDELKKWNSTNDSANLTSPELSLLDVPHLLTPDRLAKIND